MKSIKERIEAEQQDEKLIKLRDKVVNNIKYSRSSMHKLHMKWDQHNDVYKGVRPIDAEDAEAIELNEPEKMVVPMSFAQIQTFVAFCFLLFTQNKRFYEFMATGAEDYESTNDAEELLERDLRRNHWNSMLYQFLLDTARFGVGVFKSWWSVEKQVAPMTMAPSETNANGFAFQSAGGTSTQEFTKYEGNRLENISPYSFFPDTRFPLSKWRKGAFVGDETEWHITELQKWEKQGLVYGVKHIEPMSKDEFSKRKGTRLEGLRSFMGRENRDKDDQIVCLTECQLSIVPSEYDLGEEDYPVKYVVQVANDDRILKAEPLGYMHDEWTYDVGLFSADMHQKVSESLSDIIFALQDVVSFLINSRLTSVRKSLENNMIIDPSAVDMASVEARSPWILMKKGSPRVGVDKFIRQLNYVDTTSQHLNDADMMMKMMQMVTGVNENSMGQFSGGRRSATEARAVNAGSASRMKVTATVIWTDAIASLGRKMHINQRQGISEQEFTKVLGEAASERFSKFKPEDPSKLVGVEDFFVFDGTLQSEKGFIAQSLQELVSAMMSNPMVMQILPLDTGKIIEEILALRGVDNIERFKIEQNGIPNTGIIPEPVQQPVGAMPPGMPGLPPV